jgi:Domain of unknown function (DUF4375)
VAAGHQHVSARRHCSYRAEHVVPLEFGLACGIALWAMDVWRGLEWLSGYSGQTTEELVSLAGKCRTDSLVLAFEQAIDQKEFKRGKNRITPAERIVQAVEALEREVNDGGYSQFFTNSSREFAPIIVESLHSIGCTQVAIVTEMATSALDVPDLSHRP